MMMSAPARRQAALVYNPIKVDEKRLRAAVRDLSRDAGQVSDVTTVGDRIVTPSPEHGVLLGTAVAGDAGR